MIFPVTRSGALAGVCSFARTWAARSDDAVGEIGVLARSAAVSLGGWAPLDTTRSPGARFRSVCAQSRQRIRSGAGSSHVRSGTRRTPRARAGSQRQPCPTRSGYCGPSLSADCSVISNCPQSQASLLSQLGNAGRSWREYAQSMPSSCYPGNDGYYARTTRGWESRGVPLGTPAGAGRGSSADRNDRGTDNRIGC